MKCRYCQNLTLFSSPICAHCGEELFEEEDAQPYLPELPRHERTQDPQVDRWQGITLAAVIVVVFGIGGFVTYDQWPAQSAEATPIVPPTASPTEPLDTGTPSADPSDEIDAMATVLQSAHASRQELPGTLGSCSTVTTDVGPLQQLIQERTSYAQQAQNLQTDAIPNGASIQQALESMLQTAIDADQQYLAWAQRRHCKDASHDSAIGQANATATAAKHTFVDLWNQLAAQYGQTTYNWDDF